MRQLPPPPLPFLMSDQDLKIQRGSTRGRWRNWDSEAAPCVLFKSAFLMWAVSNQNGRCAYCALEINDDVSRSITVDHFAPKDTHPRWTFYAQNLVLSCNTCNTKLKKAFDPMIVPRGESSASVPYESCGYSLVHPYFDRVAVHFKGGYKLDGSPPTAIAAISDEGRATVRVFKLDSPGRLGTWMRDYLMTTVVPSNLTGVPDGTAKFLALKVELSTPPSF